MAERRLFIADGKGGHQRLVPVSSRFFTELASYLEAERPRGHRHRPGVRRPQGPEPRESFERQRNRRGVGWCEAAGRAGARDLSRAAAHLPDPVAGGRDGARGGPGPGRARLDRVDPDLSAPGRRLARLAVPQGRRGHRRAGLRRPPGRAAAGAGHDHRGGELHSGRRRPARRLDRRRQSPRPQRHGADADLGRAGRGTSGAGRDDAPLPGADRLRAAPGQRPQHRPGAALVRRVPARAGPRGHHASPW